MLLSSFMTADTVVVPLELTLTNPYRLKGQLVESGIGAIKCQKTKGSTPKPVWITPPFHCHTRYCQKYILPLYV